MGIARIAICDTSERLSPDSIDQGVVRLAELTIEMEYTSETSLYACRYGRAVVSTSSNANTWISVGPPRGFSSLSAFTDCRTAAPSVTESVL